MSILGVNGALAGAYQYANRTQKTDTNKTGFAEQLQKTGESQFLIKKISVSPLRMGRR